MGPESIVLGRECNNKCAFCSINSREPGSGNEMPTKKAKELITQVSKKNNKLLQLTGGEPTIREDILELAEFASGLFEKIIIDTNGRALKDMLFLEKLVQAGVSGFEVTILGTTKSSHDALSCSKGSFRETVKGMGNISRAKEKFGLYFNIEFLITKKNLKELSKLNRFVSAFNPSVLSLLHIKPSGRASKNFMELFPKYSESCNEIEKATFPPNYRILNIPPCLLNKEKRKALMVPPATNITFSNKKVVSYFKGAMFHSTKKPACSKCVFDSLCPGAWKEYASHFGLNELHPLLSEAELIFKKN